MSAAFERYVGIDYSGAEACESSLKGLRVYMADRTTEPREVAPPPSPRWYWSCEKIAQWFVERLMEPPTTLVGIDHGFSFPLKYFEKYGLPHEWSVFLDDFQKHWPTDEKHTYVDFVRDGACGNGAARCGDSHRRRITEARAGAKSVFHFAGSSARSAKPRNSRRDVAFRTTTSDDSAACFFFVIATSTWNPVEPCNNSHQSETATDAAR